MNTIFTGHDYIDDYEDDDDEHNDDDYNDDENHPLPPYFIGEHHTYSNT